MRYLILLTIFFFTACTEGERKDAIRTGVDISEVTRYEVKEAGMNYVIYKGMIYPSTNGGSSGTGSLFIINLTKDSLECEMLKKQIK